MYKNWTERRNAREHFMGKGVTLPQFLGDIHSSLTGSSEARSNAWYSVASQLLVDWIKNWKTDTEDQYEEALFDCLIHVHVMILNHLRTYNDT